MSSSRLAVSSFVRNSQRFASLPHGVGEKRDEETETIITSPVTEPFDERKAALQTKRGQLFDSPVPLFSLSNPLRVEPALVRLPSVASSPFPQPPLWQQDTFSNGLALLSSTADPHTVVQSLVSHRSNTKEAAIQTDEIIFTVEDSVRAEKKERDEIRWELEALIGEQLVMEGEFTEAVRRLHRAATNGNAMAMSYLAELLFTGSGVKENKEQACQLWLSAAELGDVHAQYSIAVCYKNGDGVKKDNAEALRWMERAAIGGDADAAFYQLVRYVQAGDAVRARRYVRTACEDDEYDREVKGWIDAGKGLNKEMSEMLQRETKHTPKQKAPVTAKPPVLFYLNTN